MKNKIISVLRKVLRIIGFLMIMLSLCVSDEGNTIIASVSAIIVLFFGGFVLIAISAIGEYTDEVEDNNEVEDDYYEY